jgi:L-ascorbate metabolism protein UlaG (beta-lactamase superfamily)
MQIGRIELEWLGHSCFKIRGSKLIYTDPYRIRDSETADIILISHEHYDHCSPEDVAKIQGGSTLIITSEDCADKFEGEVKAVKPWDKVEVDDVTIQAVPAYNMDKDFHPKNKGWLGFIIDIGGQKIYHAGDTDVIPEMDKIKVDIAMLPVGGTYTMTAGQAAEAVEKLEPVYVVPMHYGSIVGSKEDAEELKRLCPQCEVIIFEPNS